MKKTLREFQVKSLCKAISTSAPPETYPGPLQISKMENFATIVNSSKKLNICLKSSKAVSCCSKPLMFKGIPDT